MEQLAQQMRKLTVQIQGSDITRSDRVHITKQFCRILQRTLNIQCRRVCNLKVKHIEAYIKYRTEQGISPRILHDEMCILRQTLEQGGRNIIASDERLSHDTLGLSGVERTGPRTVISPEHFQSVILEARKIDPGLAITLELARLLGLCPREAIQCSSSLKSWRLQIKRSEKLNLQPTSLQVNTGTIRGNKRYVPILNYNTVRQTIEQAIIIAKTRNGQLIARPDFKSAAAYWRIHTTRLGLTDDNSPHCLRDAWVEDAIRKFYLEEHYNDKATLERISMALGHNNSNYVTRAYSHILQKIKDEAKN